MTEPSSKRSRRTDSAAMWEQSSKSESASRLNGKNKKSTTAESSRRHDSRSRSRSQSQSRSREDRAKTSTRRRDREDREGRDRSRREREEPRGTKRDSRGRSRSPPNRSSPAVRPLSPPRGPRAARSRERGQDRAKDKERGVRDQRVNGSSRLSPPRVPKPKSNGNVKSNDTEMMDGIEEADDEMAMKKIMGFDKFRSTKNTKVPGNEKNYGVLKEKTSQYRQYMNRSGGFNRPLSPGA